MTVMQAMHWSNHVVARIFPSSANDAVTGRLNMSTNTKRILIVVTSNDRFGETGTKTGYYLPEVSHPLAQFKKAGFAVDFASPKGGKAPVDPSSVDTKDAENAAL